LRASLSALGGKDKDKGKGTDMGGDKKGRKVKHTVSMGLGKGGTGREGEKRIMRATGTYKEYCSIWLW